MLFAGFSVRHAATHVIVGGTLGKWGRRSVAKTSPTPADVQPHPDQSRSAPVYPTPRPSPVHFVTPHKFALR